MSSKLFGVLSLALFSCGDPRHGEVGEYDASRLEPRQDAGPGPTGDAGAHAPEDLAVTLVSSSVSVGSHLAIACEHDCVSLEARVEGGHAPYTFVWSDGEAGAIRTVCRAHAGELSVTVTDSGRDHVEFPEPQRAGSASVEVGLERCEDGGPDPVADAGEPEGCEQLNHFVNAPMCSSSPFDNRFGILLDGRVLRADRSYTLRFDRWSVEGAGTFYVYGSKARCATVGELAERHLGSAGVVTTVGDVCVRPGEDVTELTIDFVHDIPLSGGPGGSPPILCEGCAGQDSP